MHDALSVYSQPHSSDLSDSSSSTNFLPVKKLQNSTSGFHDGVVLTHSASASTPSTSDLSRDRLFTFHTARSSSASTPSREKLSSDPTTASTTSALASTHSTSYLSLDRLFTFHTARPNSTSTPSQEKLSSNQTTASTTDASSLTKTYSSPSTPTRHRFRTPLCEIFTESVHHGAITDPSFV